VIHSSRAGRVVAAVVLTLVVAAVAAASMRKQWNPSSPCLLCGGSEVEGSSSASAATDALARSTALAPIGAGRSAASSQGSSAVSSGSSGSSGTSTSSGDDDDDDSSKSWPAEGSCAVRQGEKNKLGATRPDRIAAGIDELQVGEARAGEFRVDGGERLSGGLARGQRDKVHAGMPCEQPHELFAGISAGADHGDFR